MPQTVELRSDRVHEVTGIWVEPANMPKLGAYFQKVFPIAVAKYGVLPLFSLEPQGAHAGDFVPQMMFVNEWPSLESFDCAETRETMLFSKQLSLERPTTSSAATTTSRATRISLTKWSDREWPFSPSPGFSNDCGQDLNRRRPIPQS